MIKMEIDMLPNNKKLSPLCILEETLVKSAKSLIPQEVLTNQHSSNLFAT